MRFFTLKPVFSAPPVNLLAHLRRCGQLCKTKGNHVSATICDEHLVISIYANIQHPVWCSHFLAIKNTLGWSMENCSLSPVDLSILCFWGNVFKTMYIISNSVSLSNPTWSQNLERLAKVRWICREPLNPLILTFFA